MSVTVPLEISISDLENIVDEYEGNESSFIHEFFESILKKLADETKRISENTAALNMLNPFGFIQKQTSAEKGTQTIGDKNEGF